MNNQENQFNQPNISQEPQPNFQPESPKKFNIPSWLSILIVTLIVIVIGLVSWAAYRVFVSSPVEETEGEKQVSPLPLANETANWQTYRNEEYGYEIKYPLNRALDCAEDLFKGKLWECSYIAIDYAPEDPNYMNSIDKVFIIGFEKDDNIRNASIEEIAEYTIKEIKASGYTLNELDMYKNQVKTGEELLSSKKYFSIQGRKGISYKVVEPVVLFGPYYGDSSGRGYFGKIEAEQKISFIDNNDELILLYSEAGKDELINHSFFSQILSTFKFIE